MLQYEADKQAIHTLTEKYVETLIGIWISVFHPEKCREHLNNFRLHVTEFYDDLVEQSLAKQSYVQSEIANLKMEAENLKRLLKVDVDLPTYESNDIPLVIIQDELDKSLEDLRKTLRQRKEQICELLLEQDALCEELGEPPRALLADPLPTAGEINEFRMYLDHLRDERVERMNQISTMRREIKNFLHILELKVSTETEDRLLNQRQIKMNKETFEGLKRLHHCYGSQVKELKETINGMRQKLHTLWERLQTSPNTRLKFDRYNDYNQHTYEVFYSELQRCQTLKSQNIKLYVQQLRDEISKWWEKTLKSDTQKSRFSNFTSTCYTDDLLVLHEMELEDLKLYYETNKQIFELYADRNILWDRMNALEAKASEPGRYNNRGGQLLKEEKERKTIANKLPKIEQQISELVAEYEKREHAPFLVFGENLIDVMASQWEQKQKEKEMLQSARKNAGKTPAATTSKNTNSTMKTPMSARNASTVSSLRKTPSTTSLASNNNVLSSQKRKLNPTERNTPVAKRSLMQALNSPSVFLKPSAIKTNQRPQSSYANSKMNKSASNFKSPSKKTKLIASTIRRRSGRQSGNLKKRKSINKNPGSAKAVPKIVVESASDGYTTDDTYDSFQKCIEPASRSSIIHDVSSSTNSSRTKRLQKIVNDENTRLNKLPKPRMVNRTPSKQHASFSNLTRTPTHNNHHSPVSCTTSRKLTTKNLPIII